MTFKLTKRHLDEKHERENELHVFKESYNEKLKVLLDILKICKNSQEADNFGNNSLIPILEFDLLGHPQVNINVPFAYKDDWVLPVMEKDVNYDTIGEYHSLLAEVEDFVSAINARIEKENKIKQIQSKMRETFTKEELELIGIK